MLTLMCLNIGTPETINFPFETNGKLIVSSVSIFKHFRYHVGSIRDMILSDGRSE